jgi:hypothetical protein
MQNEAIESVGLGGSRLRVEFVWQNDRYRHVIALIDGLGNVLPLLDSIEDSPASAWPTSPPFQSLNIHTLSDGRPAVLLVGMAGANHWSASIEAAADQSLVFDIACRHAAGPAWLGSRYRIVHAAAQRLKLTADIGRVTTDREALAIEAELKNQQSATTRWRYTIAVAAEKV